MSLLSRRRNLSNHLNNSFVFRINTTSTFTLPTFSGATYNATVKWGDGSESTITAYNDPNITHTYSSGGDYDIEISGLFERFYFNNTGDKLKLIRVLNWGDTGFTSIEGMFFGCTNLISIDATDGIKSDNVADFSAYNSFRLCSSLTTLPEGLFINTRIVDGRTMFMQAGLTSLPADLLQGQSALGSLESCFLQNNISSIPSGFMDGVINVNNLFSLFNGNINLSSIPENLFVNNTKVTLYRRVFKDCRNIVLPSVLFDLSKLSIVTYFDDFMNVASTSYSATGTIQDVWNYIPGGAVVVGAFRNQTGILNYASIPAGYL